MKYLYGLLIFFTTAGYCSTITAISPTPKISQKDILLSSATLIGIDSSVYLDEYELIRNELIKQIMYRDNSVKRQLQGRNYAPVIYESQIKARRKYIENQINEGNNK